MNAPMIDCYVVNGHDPENHQLAIENMADVVDVCRGKIISVKCGGLPNRELLHLVDRDTGKILRVLK